MLVLAAGNLFTGEFAYKSFTGAVQFGQTYAFTARPSAMKVKYHAHVGTVDKVRTSGDICPYQKGRSGHGSYFRRDRRLERRMRSYPA